MMETGNDDPVMLSNLYDTSPSRSDTSAPFRYDLSLLHRIHISTSEKKTQKSQTNFLRKQNLPFRQIISSNLLLHIRFIPPWPPIDYFYPGLAFAIYFAIPTNLASTANRVPILELLRAPASYSAGPFLFFLLVRFTVAS